VICSNKKRVQNISVADPFIWCGQPSDWRLDRLIRTVLWVCGLSSWLRTRSLTAQHFLQSRHFAVCQSVSAFNC